MTHTETYALMNAWAQTISRDPATCCAVCSEPIPVDEICYHVTQLERGPDGEPPVCWRHVSPNNGPLTVPPR
jgi:hypothetical protein